MCVSLYSLTCAFVKIQTVKTFQYEGRVGGAEGSWEILEGGGCWRAYPQRVSR